MRRKILEKSEFEKIGFVTGVMSVVLFILFFILPEMFPDTPKFYLSTFFMFSFTFLMAVFAIIIGIVNLIFEKRYKKKLLISGIILGCLVIIFSLFILILSKIV